MSYPFFNGGNFDRNLFVGTYGDRSRHVAASMRQHLHESLNGGQGSLFDAINNAQAANKIDASLANTMHEKRQFMNSIVHSPFGTFGSSANKF